MLSDTHRKLLHDLSLGARGLLMQEAHDVLQGVYGLEADGRWATAAPQVGRDPELAAIHHRLRAYLDDEARAGLPRVEAVDKLVKEIAFTHLNRLAAFKMMEVRGLIRGTVDKGTNSNAFKLWLVDHPDEMARYEAEGPGGGADEAYRRFLLWQAGQVARELAVLFDPDALPGLIFPRPRVLGELLKLINNPDLAGAWAAEEAVGWLYQFFNEEEKAQVFDRLYKQKQKIRRADIPAATQLFTPDWIVRFLVQNTLGRLWVQMHPDTRLRGTPLLDYLAPLPDAPPEPLRPVGEITLLDPAGGTMHFGLAAFDLFAAMYAEEIDRAGEPGWPAAPSVADPAAIAAAILADNLYGIDIDLRAVQLSALALYLRAKRLNKHAVLRAANHVCADVLPLNGERLAAFLAEARLSPLTERLIRELWGQLRDAGEVGSLLRLERAVGEAIERAQRDYARQPLLARMDAGYGAETADGEAFWDVLAAQVEQGLDEFARTHGDAARFFAGEAQKGVRLLGLLRRRYDVVVTNPPYSGRSNLTESLAGFLEDQYPDSKGDLYTAFIERCSELTNPGGRVGMVTLHSFMFLSSYKVLRHNLTTDFTVEVINHMGPRTFMDLSNPNAQGFVAFCLRHAPAPPTARLTAIRLVNAPGGDEKRVAFEAALRDGSDTYRLAQTKFDAIPGSPWAYWVSERIRRLFEELPALGKVAQPRGGLTTGDNFRFLRFWWEAGQNGVAFSCPDGDAARVTGKRWFPCMKGGAFRRWYGNQEIVINWKDDGKELYGFQPGSFVRNPTYYFREALTWSTLTSSSFSGRYMPPGFIFETKGSAAFSDRLHPSTLLAVANSTLFTDLFKIISPTIDYHEGYMARVPFPAQAPSEHPLAIAAIYQAITQSLVDELTFDFVAPLDWHDGAERALAAESRLAALERQIDDEVYRLYGIADADRALIEAELGGQTTDGAQTTDDRPQTTDDAQTTDGGEDAAGDSAVVGRPSSVVSPEELAVRWISYAVGVVLGRFSPGTPGALGRAVYRPDDFAVGSLPAPDAAEFDQLVGPAERFAYVDADGGHGQSGGRHVFPAAVEAALRALALGDGIAVLDPGHPRDLPALVERALELMVGEAEMLAIVRAGAGGDLRRFLGGEFFKRYHFSWYRKRPVYWPLQTAGRAFGLVVFHERVGEAFLYVVLRDYLDQKTRALELALADARGRAERSSGAARRAAEREAQSLNGQLLEVADFAAAVKRLADGGYRPRADWIDDGVILRLAPLHELIPLWRAEPKKHWERLARGDFDWSHIAMAYWPERVREKCRTDKSLAIAHGVE